ncbi:MAG: hypothetical protein Greene101449_98 [Candidatus Peregrinibacteria bacterium Greene1014_49]|nr:MAG: hypothetical protein Greene101449_98 [Candidatus Peregrinibacteria bacterium Greene1014_49]
MNEKILQGSGDWQRPSFGTLASSLVPGRKLVIRSLAGVLFLGISGDAEQRAVEGPRTHADGRQSIDTMPLRYSTIRVCEEPTSDPTVMIVINEKGEIVFASYQELHRRDFLHKTLKARRDFKPGAVPAMPAPEKKISTGVGSGFIFRIGNQEMLGSNEHVLGLTTDARKKHGVFDADADFAIMPLTQCAQKFPYAAMDVDSGLVDKNGW